MAIHTVYLRVEVEGAANAQDARDIVAAALDTGALHNAVKDNQDVKATVLKVVCDNSLGKLER